MNTPTSEEPTRYGFYEMVQKPAHSLEELPDGLLPLAYRHLERMREEAAADPSQPWRPFNCEEDDDEARDILNLFAAGLVRVAILMDHVTREQQVVATPA